MKKYIILMLLLVAGLTFYYREELVVFYVNHFMKVDKNVKLTEKNEYYKDSNFNYVHNVDDFIPHNKQDLLNIYYTIINSGVDEFSFYCNDKEYSDCIDDVNDLANDQTTLSHINNFVHPLNGFKNIETEYDSLGKVTVSVQKTYSEDKIKAILSKVDEIEEKIINNNMTDEEKIKAVHDYIINNSKYDSKRSDENIVSYDSDTAYGNLIQGYGLCGGYTDSMALFLEKFNIVNYKVSSENHIWNAVLLDGSWYHLDLTWDDPITTTNEDILEYNFFLISTKELQELEEDQHHFSTAIYQELK